MGNISLSLAFQTKHHHTIRVDDISTEPPTNFSKVIDAILIRLVSFYSRNNLLGEFQHSFIQGKSKQQCQILCNPYQYLY
jgi:hypothetical protein